MNNRGFTLIEVVITIVIISLILTITANFISSSLALSSDETYKLMKNNIVSVSYNYVDECTNNIIDCDFDFQDNNEFKASVLKKYGYFDKLNSPIDNKDLGECLILKAFKNNGVVVVELEDNCY